MEKQSLGEFKWISHVVTSRKETRKKGLDMHTPLDNILYYIILIPRRFLIFDNLYYYKLCARWQ